MPLSVTIDSVTLAGSMGVQVSGSGSPNAAVVAIKVQITGGGSGNGESVTNNGQWATTVMIPNVHTGQTGTATATITSSQFPGQSAQGQKNFTL